VVDYEEGNVEKEQTSKKPVAKKVIVEDFGPKESPVKKRGRRGAVVETEFVEIPSKKKARGKQIVRVVEEQEQSVTETDKGQTSACVSVKPIPKQRGRKAKQQESIAEEEREESQNQSVEEIEERTIEAVPMKALPKQRGRKAKQQESIAEEERQESQNQSVEEIEERTIEAVPMKAIPKQRGRKVATSSVPEEVVQDVREAEPERTVESISSTSSQNEVKKRGRKPEKVAPAKEKVQVSKKRARKADVNEDRSEKDEPVALQPLKRGRKAKEVKLAQSAVAKVPVLAQDLDQDIENKFPSNQVDQAGSEKQSVDAHHVPIAFPMPQIKTFPEAIRLAAQPLISSCSLSQEQVQEFYESIDTPDITVKDFLLQMGDFGRKRLDEKMTAFLQTTA
jgi:hypothetical protein